MEKDNNLSKVLVKMWGAKICTKKVNVEGISDPIEFDIYDGYAVSTNKVGNVYEMQYPMMKAIKQCKGLSDEIVKYIGSITSEEISPLHSLITFSTLYEDGKEITEESVA